MDRPNAWDWLFSGHVPERDKTFYRAQIAEGRTALSVLIDGGGASVAKIDAVEDILDRFHPVDVRVEEEAEGGSSSAGGRAGAQAARGAAARKGARAAEEEIIPLAREEAHVGAQATDRVRHVKTYIVEEPFDQEVSLSDEHVVVERRAATSGEAGELSAQDYEFHERHEKPVVEMTTRTDEELVVRKEPSKHTERVHGTVRRMEAAVDEEEESGSEEEKGSERGAAGKARKKE